MFAGEASTFGVGAFLMYSSLSKLSYHSDTAIKAGNDYEKLIQHNKLMHSRMSYLMEKTPKENL